MTTDVLPDDVLIEIFDFHLNGMSIFDDDMNDEYGMIRWHTLVHVCQRWRQLIFTSPCRLGLVLEYNGKKPMREMLDVWPVLPIAIRLRALESLLKPSHADNIVDALDLENHARIHEIKLDEFPRSHWDRFVGAMQKPFPQLRNLQIGCSGGATAVLPISDLFLGGSVSHLQKLRLENIQFPFPGVQKQLLTANNLVELSLWTTPLSGYISPEAMVICLSAMPRLEILLFRVDFPRFRP
ncbi:hypothetical protein F5148DRAFT_582841 [Russula earlei]|uniref:Uncharacterized protein n=1 Tax=Russula earlei TaxID=71964 RepID=A0ACC0UH91_9AGAM|nr:hypothetical protein F5148DRAFT_582841 [Russula earlei]